MLLWAGKFAAAKIECRFEMGKQTPFLPLILLVMVHSLLALLTKISLKVNASNENYIFLSLIFSESSVYYFYSLCKFVYNCLAFARI